MSKDILGRIKRNSNLDEACGPPPVAHPYYSYKKTLFDYFINQEVENSNK